MQPNPKQFILARPRGEIKIEIERKRDNLKRTFVHYNYVLLGISALVDTGFSFRFFILLNCEFVLLNQRQK